MAPAMTTSVTAPLDPGLAALEQARQRHRARPLVRTIGARGLGPYRGYAELLAAMARLRRDGARLHKLGDSVRGEPLLALELGQADPTPCRRTSVVLAGLHPIEWIGVETALTLTERLLGRPLGNRSVLVLPMCNPDGLLRVERNLRAGRRRFVRHNAHGVDLNRNFDVQWGYKNLLARLVPWVFRPGSYPSSEPEVTAIAEAVGGRRVDRALSLHSFGGAVLYPSGHTMTPIPDADEHHSWARRIASRADRRAYRAVPSWRFGFGATMGGLELDWFHRRHGAVSLLAECSRGGLGLRPSRLLDPFAWFNPPQPGSVARRIAEAAEDFVAGEPG